MNDTEYRAEQIAVVAREMARLDLVNVVRCRDCKHFTYADAAHGDDDWCAKHDHIGWSVNGFCAWGERRERESAEVWNQWSADDVTCSEES